MKLTERGRDYHIAILLVAFVGLASGERIFAAVALALAFSSMISLAVLTTKGRKRVKIDAKNYRLRVFKGEEGLTTLEIPAMKDRWTRLAVESAALQGPVTSRVWPEEGNRLTIGLTPRTAGRFVGVDVAMRLEDTLGLFRISNLNARVELVLDSLPVSLLRGATRPFVSPLALGERPAGTPGRGQEFYGVEEYTERAEAKNILWKRAAKAPERPLLAGVRESNIPESISLTVIRGRTTGEQYFLATDLLCEALGSLGRTLLQLNVRVDTDGGNEGEHLRVTDEEGLADAIMEASSWTGKVSAESIRASNQSIPILVGDVGPSFEDTDGFPRIVIMPVDQRTIGRQAIDYTGDEDLSWLAGLVLAS